MNLMDMAQKALLEGNAERAQAFVDAAKMIQEMTFQEWAGTSSADELEAAFHRGAAYRPCEVIGDQTLIHQYDRSDDEPT